MNIRGVARQIFGSGKAYARASVTPMLLLRLREASNTVRRLFIVWKPEFREWSMAMCRMGNSLRIFPPDVVWKCLLSGQEWHTADARGSDPVASGGPYA